jgi:ATP-binding protein involved in chromosome partitioning
MTVWGGRLDAGKADVSRQILDQRRRVSDRLAQIRNVVAVMSGKGGVGKSALTANLAAALGQRGRAVGVLDADLYGASAAAMLGARGQPVWIGPAGARPATGVADVKVMSMDLFLDGDDSPVDWKHPGGLAADSFTWRGSLEAGVLREYLSDTDWGALDYLLIDMPPGADRFEVLLRLVPRLSGALVVTIPSRIAQLVVRRAVQSARQAGARVLGLVENMAGPDGSAGEAFVAQPGIPFLGSIPYDPRLARATDAGRPFVLTGAKTPAGQAILSLADHLERILAV